eukprot:CAMPEP_0202870478 /NCGR_PEP_ID=MMETSP1391-20130828/15854_1 /ASSEMBLY_ACC=CAM_ASM_000867 /TAXON_ID=1034604 /ORGANISM="Chlamydomonas leiostraca, Strain SAG 11-49" /LENGTH=187 /DNA_ID=CAMNT_0049551057 /DNA_START=195 /DNA_END=755 /DNA_ORIENTATION=+
MHVGAASPSPSLSLLPVVLPLPVSSDLTAHRPSKSLMKDEWMRLNTSVRLSASSVTAMRAVNVPEKAKKFHEHFCSTSNPPVSAFLCVSDVKMLLKMSGHASYAVSTSYTKLGEAASSMRPSTVKKSLRPVFTYFTLRLASDDVVASSVSTDASVVVACAVVNLQTGAYFLTAWGLPMLESGFAPHA